MWITTGIIGYITPETAFLSSPGPDITFSDAVEAVKEEASKLKEQGVNIIVAVGHAGKTIKENTKIFSNKKS